jgi:hypothetical protein
MSEISKFTPHSDRRSLAFPSSRSYSPLAPLPHTLRQHRSALSVAGVGAAASLPLSLEHVAASLSLAHVLFLSRVVASASVARVALFLLEFKLRFFPLRLPDLQRRRWTFCDSAGSVEPKSNRARIVVVAGEDYKTARRPSSSELLLHVRLRALSDQEE